MKYKINLRGLMIPNDYKWIYDFLGMESTCPKDVLDILDKTIPGDEVEVYINSPGGVIDVGSEIYTALRATDAEVKIYITGQACSAASIVAMAGYCEMSPTALMMVHCVSTETSGNHSAMEHTAEVLRTADRALCTAYTEKTGMSETEALAMMEKETWLSANRAKEHNLIDKIMFEEKENHQMVAGPEFRLPDKTEMENIRKMLKLDDDGNKTTVSEMQCKLNLLKLKNIS